MKPGPASRRITFARKLALIDSYRARAGATVSTASRFRTTRLSLETTCHVSFSGSVPHVNWNTDHWKMKVHEGFLTKPGDPGSLTLFTPSSTKHRRQQPHMSFAKHITAEVWEERFVPGYRGMVCKWWKDGSQNHYLDAATQGLVARSLLGATTLTPHQEPPTESAPETRGNEPSSTDDRRSW